MMKKTLLKIVIGACSLLVLAAIVMAGVSMIPNDIHSNVIYNDTAKYASLEKISAVRPPLAAPSTHLGSTDVDATYFVCDLQPVG